MISAMPVPPDDTNGALPQALECLMAPLARLCLARGLTFAAAAELLKRAYVDAARAAQPGAAGSRDISRVSTATGLTRREVTRITHDVTAPAAIRRSPATQVFTKWLGSPGLHDADGRPTPLKRQGSAPSFEALAQSVTRDVHPRSLLEELCRLGLARLDDTSDTVSLVRDAFVPGEDQTRMLGFLGHNVGDHLSAAVSNVLAQGEPHFEQAIFADELSAQSIPEVRALVRTQWKAMLATLVPRIEALIEEDGKTGRRADQRLRIGLYGYHAPMTSPPPEASKES
jgi:hypothetical protein